MRFNGSAIFKLKFPNLVSRNIVEENGALLANFVLSSVIGVAFAWDCGFCDGGGCGGGIVVKACIGAWRVLKK